MKKKLSIIDITMWFCYSVLLFFALTITSKFFVKQILVDKLNWDNTITGFFDWDVNRDSEVLQEEDVNSYVDWEEEYPFSDSDNVHVSFREKTLIEKYMSGINAIKSKMGGYFGDQLLWHMQITRLGKSYNAAIGCAAMPTDNSIDSVIVMNNGYLTFTEPRIADEDLMVLADNVADFSVFLSEKNIDFVYANAGSKVCRSDKQLPNGVEENTNENADRLIQYLEERDVNVLDYRPLQEEKFENWYESYYVTDHHWKNTTALWAAGVLAEYLNENDGFHFDLKNFDESSYSIETSDNYFLGCQGRILTTAIAEPESFSRVVPLMDTDFSVYIPTKGINVRGSYTEALFDDDFYRSISEYKLKDHDEKRDAYDSVTWRNDVLGNFHNNLKTNNDGKRILMIQDSFGWYLSTYLAMDIEDVDVIYLPDFTGSIRSYIEKTEPDAVVLLICERNISPIELTDIEQHSHWFDFR